MIRLITALWLLAAGSVLAIPWPLPQRPAVVVDQDSDQRNGAESGRDAALAEAWARYLEFYLNAIGYPPAITATHRDLLSARQLASDSGCDMLVFVEVSGGFRHKTSLQVLEHRRHRFVTTGGLLELKVKYALMERRGETWVIVSKGTVKESADPDWIDRLGRPVPEAVRQGAQLMAEPIEYVLQRCAERVVVEMGFRARDARSADTAAPSIPIEVAADLSYIAAHRNEWSQLAELTVGTAAAFYAAEFGVRVHAIDVQPARASFGGAVPIRDLYEALSYQNLKRGDTVLLSLYASPSPIEHALGRDHEEIGLSETGENLIVVRDLPVPQSRDWRWSAQFTGLNFAHELGHQLGAIHVSDARSLMNHTLSWLVPDGIDELNTAIIKAKLEHRLRPTDTAAYAGFVAATIDSSGYNLADIPQFFYRMLPLKENSAGPKSPFARIKPVYFLAARGYGHLIHGELPAAAELFRQAVASEPEQASLHYYLAHCTGGEESRRAWQTAASLGYWQAQIAMSQSTRKR